MFSKTTDRTFIIMCLRKLVNRKSEYTDMLTVVYKMLRPQKMCNTGSNICFNHTNKCTLTH